MVNDFSFTQNVRSRPQVSLQSFAYTPYGYRPRHLNLLGFNGERPDPITHRYLLGNGYRGFDSVLMRFVSPDSMSPFRRGGMNSYAYCLGDPVNLQDPSGNFSIRRFFSRIYEKIAVKTGLNKVSKGSGKYAYLGSSEVVREQMQKKLPAQVKSYPNPSSVPAGFNFAGFHGSNKANTASLEEGIKLERLKRGEFYFSQAYDVASAYARSSGGHVFGVYIKDFKSLVSGEQLVDISHGVNKIREGYMLNESAFDRAIVRKEVGGNLVRRNSYREPPVYIS